MWERNKEWSVQGREQSASLKVGRNKQTQKKLKYSSEEISNKMEILTILI